MHRSSLHAYLLPSLLTACMLHCISERHASQHRQRLTACVPFPLLLLLLCALLGCMLSSFTAYHHSGMTPAMLLLLGDGVSFFIRTRGTTDSCRNLYTAAGSVGGGAGNMRLAAALVVGNMYVQHAVSAGDADTQLAAQQVFLSHMQLAAQRGAPLLMDERNAHIGVMADSHAHDSAAWDHACQSSCLCCHFQALLPGYARHCRGPHPGKQAHAQRRVGPS